MPSAPGVSSVSRTIAGPTISSSSARTRLWRKSRIEPRASRILCPRRSDERRRKHRRNSRRLQTAREATRYACWTRSERQRRWVAPVAAGRVNTTAPRDLDAELDQFTKRVSTAWHEGEVRPTQRQPPRPKRHCLTRNFICAVGMRRALLSKPGDSSLARAQTLSRIDFHHPTFS
jgi:hypothetical protein